MNKYILAAMPFDKPVIITVEGELKPFPPKDETYTLEELQEAVNGYIEIKRLVGDYVMVLDEEGRLNNKKFNPKATDLALQCNDTLSGNYAVIDTIVGDVLLCRDEMID